MKLKPQTLVETFLSMVPSVHFYIFPEVFSTRGENNIKEFKPKLKLNPSYSLAPHWMSFLPKKFFPFYTIKRSKKVSPLFICVHFLFILECYGGYFP
jgi:hypothetical protein